MIALSRTRDLVTWEHAATPLVVPDRAHDTALSPFLGIAAQAARGDNTATTLRRTTEHPECWEFDVNDADFCCQRGSGAPDNVAYLLYSPSSQGTPPLRNCSSLGLRSPNFNGVASANVSLSDLLQSRF